jgi:hypothetical protein
LFSEDIRKEESAGPFCTHRSTRVCWQRKTCQSLFPTLLSDFPPHFLEMLLFFISSHFENPRSVTGFWFFTAKVPFSTTQKLNSVMEKGFFVMQVPFSITDFGLSAMEVP